MGETPIVAPPAAIANAIARATGVRMTELPMSPPRLLAALDSAEPTAPSRGVGSARVVPAKAGIQSRGCGFRRPLGPAPERK